MAIKELTQEQVRTMTLQEKDQWWLDNVYRGNMPQLNLRSAITGMLLGGILSLTNLYVGIKTGWTLGVGLSSVILSFTAFKVISKLKLGKEMTILENNAMQSVATSAGYMTAPLVAALPAYMLITGKVIPQWQVTIWIILLPILGVLYAFPLKRRFINDEQLPFLEGYAAAIVLNNLHTDEGEKEGLFKTKLLGLSAGLSGLIETMRSDKIMAGIKLPFLTLPEHWDDFIYKFVTPTILGTPLKDLAVQVDTSIVMLGTGGLMGTKVGISMILGAVLDYLILAPIMIKNGVIQGHGFKAITMWALWGGAAMMTTSSLFSFFSKPAVFVAAFKNLFSKNKQTDILAHIELPTKVSFIGIPIVGAAIAFCANQFFGVTYFEAFIALPLIFVFTLIAVTSTGLTSVTPGGALGKLTQLSYSVISPGKTATNVLAAGINGDVSLSASNLLMDIKPGYMLGAKPRHQAVGHILGVFAGALVVVPVYYLMFHNDISLFTSDKLPMPGAMIWKAVADVLSKGLSALHPTTQIAVLIGGVLGIIFEMLNIRMKGKFPISPMGMGLAFVMRFTDSMMMGCGSILFWYLGKKIKDPNTTAYKIWVDNKETICAGIIAGGSIIGVIIILLETVVFS